MKVDDSKQHVSPHVQSLNYTSPNVNSIRTFQKKPKWPLLLKSVNLGTFLAVKNTGKSFKTYFPIQRTPKCTKTGNPEDVSNVHDFHEPPSQ